jgi:hypothetical protein
MYLGLLVGRPGAWGIVVPDLAGCRATGHTKDTVLDNAIEAVTLWAEAPSRRGIRCRRRAGLRTWKSPTMRLWFGCRVWEQMEFPCAVGDGARENGRDPYPERTGVRARPPPPASACCPGDRAAPSSLERSRAQAAGVDADAAQGTRPNLIRMCRVLGGVHCTGQSIKLILVLVVFDFRKILSGLIQECIAANQIVDTRSHEATECILRSTHDRLTPDVERRVD